MHAASQLSQARTNALADIRYYSNSGHLWQCDRTAISAAKTALRSKGKHKKPAIL
jgi:hypothetical protein